jgi:hypothetical protein
MKMTLNQDIFYPKETLHLDVNIENTKCKKPCESFAARLIRRIEITDMKKKKLFLGHDTVVLTKDYASDCQPGAGSTQAVDIEIPEDIYVTEEERKKYPELVLDDKHLEKGLSSSFLG